MGDSWTHTTLGEVADIQIGRTPPRAESRFWTKELERPFCTITDMRGWRIRPEREGVTAEAEQEGKARRFPAGALLMSFKLTIGKIGFASVDLFPNEAIAAIEPNAGIDLSKEYLAYWLANSDFTRHAGRAAKGKTLNKGSLQAIEVVVPPLADQARIVDFMRAIDDLARGAEQVLRSTTAARTSLLRSVMAQDIEFPESYDRLLRP